MKWKELSSVVAIRLAGWAALAVSAVACAASGPEGAVRGESSSLTVGAGDREALIDAVADAAPGEVIVLEEGTWNDEQLVLKGSGEAARPVVVRAETPGKVIFSGKSSVTLEGEHMALEGIHFRDGWLDGGHVVLLDGTHLQLRETVIDSYDPPDSGTRYFWVSLRGEHHLVEHCTFRGMNHSGVTLTVWRDGSRDFHHIRRNHFVDRPHGGHGWESMRIGTSTHSLTDSHTLVEENLFERCHGEIETISNKAGRNIFRRNTFRGNQGTLSLRHGDGCIVDSNFFFGENVEDSGGIRVCGEDHRIVNNYIEGTAGRGGAAISLRSGNRDSGRDRESGAYRADELTGFFAPHGTTVAFNTIVDVDGPHIHLSFLSHLEDRDVVAREVTLANNLMYAGGFTGGEFVVGDPGDGFRAEGNLGFGRDVGSLEAEEFRLEDPGMKRAENGLWRPDPEGPARGTAVGHFPQVAHDMDGQPRVSREDKNIRWPNDVGADEHSDEPVSNRPLHAGDVGAGWFAMPEVSP